MNEKHVSHHRFLLQRLAHWLDTLAGKPVAPKSGILTDALNPWLNGQAARDFDRRFSAAIDRGALALRRINRDRFGVFVVRVGQAMATRQGALPPQGPAACRP
jgi:hypothetical protein